MKKLNLLRNKLMIKNQVWAVGRNNNKWMLKMTTVTIIRKGKSSIQMRKKKNNTKNL